MSPSSSLGNTTSSTNTNNDEFASLANLLETAINKDRSQDKALESLSHYTCSSDAQGEYLSQEELLELLQKQAEIDGEVKADDIVAMWEPLEYRYTVNQLLDEIGI